MQRYRKKCFINIYLDAIDKLHLSTTPCLDVAKSNKSCPYASCGFFHFFTFSRSRFGVVNTMLSFAFIVIWAGTRDNARSIVCWNRTSNGEEDAARQFTRKAVHATSLARCNWTMPVRPKLLSKSTSFFGGTAASWGREYFACKSMEYVLRSRDALLSNARSPSACTIRLFRGE
jgi:hypothetical protein